MAEAEVEFDIVLALLQYILLLGDDITYYTVIETIVNYKENDVLFVFISLKATPYLFDRSFFSEFHEYEEVASNHCLSITLPRGNLDLFFVREFDLFTKRNL